MSKFKIIFPLTLCAFLILCSLNILAEQKIPITSWRDIVIGKTTEEEIIAENPEGSVRLSVTELLELIKGQDVLRVFDYGAESSYAEEKRKKSEFDAQGHDIARRETSNKEEREALLRAFEFLSPHPESKLEESLKPTLLKNGPIDLRWDKLGCAKLYIYSNGVVQGWTMKYWFFDPSDAESLKERNLPTKDEVLEIFEIELGKPEKILKPDSQYDVYVYSVDGRKLKLKLQYYKDKKVLYIEFFEKNMLSILSERAIELYKEKPETK